MTRNVAVTGCCGFIGSNLTRHFLDLGWNVFGVDDMSGGHEEFLPKKFWFLKRDFTDRIFLDAVRDGKFDAVVHLAAIPRVSFSVEHPLSTNEANVTKTLTLMEACKGNVGRFVFASSSSVYGGASVLPTHESAPKNPKSPYALQKSIVEDYMRLYWELYKMDSAALRFHNVFGPRQLGNSPYSTAVSAWITALMRGVPLRFDGSGEQSRDMCYVDNVVDACERAVTTPGQLLARPYNIACGDRTTNNQIYEYLKKEFKVAPRIDAPERPGDVMHTQADITRAREELGYVPLVRFFEGLDKTIAWNRDNWDKIKDM